jgi:hypothetical protein
VLYLLWQSRTPQIQSSRDSSEIVKGLYIASSIIVAPGVLVLVSGLAMWKCKLWGWWLAIIADTCLMLVFVYSVINDGWRHADPDDIVFTVLSIIPVVLLALPAVRNHTGAKASRSLKPKHRLSRATFLFPASSSTWPKPHCEL